MFVSRFGTRENIQLPSFSSKDTKTFRLWKTHKKKAKNTERQDLEFNFLILLSISSSNKQILPTETPKKEKKEKEKKKEKKEGRIYLNNRGR